MPVIARPFAAVPVCAVVVLLSAAPVAAQPYYWDGGTSGTAQAWNTSTNWSTDTNPPSGADLVFDNRTGSGQLPSTLVVGGNRTVGSVTFDGVNGRLPASQLDINANLSGSTDRTLTINTGITISNYSQSVRFGVVSTYGLLNIALGSNVTMTPNGSSTLVLKSPISGAGFGITKNGTGTLSLTGANTYTGATAVNSGVLALGVAGPGTSQTSGVTVAGGAQLQLTKQDGAYAVGTGSVTLNGSGVSGSAGALRYTVTAGTATLSNAVNLASAASVAASSGGTLQLSGQISGAGPLTITDAGTVALTGANTYTGGTTVAAGTLLANNATGSGTGSGAVAVNSGGTLGGTGTVAGAVTVASGGTLAAGAGGAGLLTLQSGLDLSNGGTLQVEISGPTAGTDYDQVKVTSGAVTLGNGVALLSIPTHTGAFGSSNVLYIIDNTGAGSTTGYFQGLAEGSTVTAMGGTGGFDHWSIFYNADHAGGTLAGGNDVALVGSLTPTPEPAGVLLAAAAGLGVVHRARQRRRTSGG